MCGRFALGVPRSEIYEAVNQEHPDLDLDGWVNEDAFYPRFNIAPRSRSTVIRRRNRYDDPPAETDTVGETREDEVRGTNDTTQAHEVGRQPKEKAVLHTMKWGLVPHWSKHEDTSLNTINAKGESLTEGGGGMWNSIKGKKRCAVLCQGYYEWLKRGKDRIPHFTKHSSGRLMLLAGLYDSVVLEGTTERLYTFTIVTTDASKQLDWLHDRMPVVLRNAVALATWLDTSSQSWDASAAALVKPYPIPPPTTGPGPASSLKSGGDANAGASLGSGKPGGTTHKGTQAAFGPLECYPVPTDVGKVGAESPTFVEPVQKRRDGIEAMFARAKRAGKAAEGDGEGKVSVKASEALPQKRKRDESAEAKEEIGRESSVELLECPPPDTKRSKKPVSKKPPSSSPKETTQDGKTKITGFFIKNSE